MPDLVLLNYIYGVLNECIFILTLTRIDRLCIVASHMYYVKPKVSNLALWGVCNIIVDCYGLSNVYLQTPLALASFIRPAMHYMQAGLFASLISVHNDTSASPRVYMDVLDEHIGVGK